MFRNDAQKCQAILALLQPSGMDQYWTETGPSEIAVSLLERNGGGHSSGQALMLKVAFDIWNGEGKATLGDILGKLDEINLGMLSTLMSAANVSAEDVDRWIKLEARNKDTRAAYARALATPGGKARLAEVLERFENKKPVTCTRCGVPLEPTASSLLYCTPCALAPQG